RVIGTGVQPTPLGQVVTRPLRPPGWTVGAGTHSTHCQPGSTKVAELTKNAALASPGAATSTRAPIGNPNASQSSAESRSRRPQPAWTTTAYTTARPISTRSAPLQPMALLRSISNCLEPDGVHHEVLVVAQPRGHDHVAGPVRVDGRDDAADEHLRRI